MNRKLTAFANTLECLSAVLLLLSALRADGGLPFWLPMALLAVTTGLAGLGLSFLCSEEGRRFRRRLLARHPRLCPRPKPLPSSPSPKQDKQNTVCSSQTAYGVSFVNRHLNGSSWV